MKNKIVKIHTSNIEPGEAECDVNIKNPSSNNLYGFPYKKHHESLMQCILQKEILNNKANYAILTPEYAYIPRIIKLCGWNKNLYKFLMKNVHKTKK